jgi:hypothetical protein
MLRSAHVASVPRYRGTFCRWHALSRRLLQAGAFTGVAVVSAGCSLSYQLDTFGKSKVDQVGSLRPTPGPGTEPPAEGDLAIARAALSEILARGGKDASMPWDNPQTGTRGTVTPLANVYSQNGLTCRDFLASFVKNGSESWLQGEACRAERGRWEVRNLRPWKST